jgi:hypothetical protein
MKTLFFLFFLSFQAFANGSNVGNGGHVIKCSENYEVLDLFEGFQAGHSYFLSTPFSFRFHLFELKKRWSSLPSVYAFLVRVDLGYRRIVEFVDYDIDLVHDYGEIVLPYGCGIVQTALLQNVGGQNERLIINKTIWNKLSEYSKAALVAHEFLYREAILNTGTADSVKVRQLVRLLLTDELVSLGSRADRQQLHYLESKFFEVLEF